MSKLSLLALFARRSERAGAAPDDQQEVVQLASSSERPWLVRFSSQAAGAARALIWGVSLFVVVVSLLSSLSRSSPIDFASSVRSISPETSMDLDAIPEEDLSTHQMGATESQSSGPAANASETVAQPFGEASAPAFRVLLAAWSNTTSGWVAALDQETSSYTEGDFVPFLLRIDDAEPGTTYDLELTYRCLVSERHAFDFVSSLKADQQDPMLTAPGPGRTTPDSSLIVPDDASIEFDGSDGATIAAWGATFRAASEPEPQTDCTDAKTINISIVAQDSTIMLVWTGHLASSEDWGEGNGASAEIAFNLDVSVDGAAKQILTLLPGSVAE